MDPRTRPESLATIHAAIDAGVTLLDTGDFYGMGHNEMLLGQALRFFREKVLISVKFGAQRGPDGAWLGYDARPAAVKTALAYSLKRLGVDYIDIYRPARLDPNVPIEDTIGAIADMIKAGYVRHIGLSEVGPETIRRAAKVHPIVDLQIEYSLISRAPESKIFPVLEELGIAVTAYGVLSRGLLSGSPKNGPGDIRNRFPRFAAENQAQNQKLIARLERDRLRQGRYAIATCHGVGIRERPVHHPGHRGAHPGAVKRKPGSTRCDAIRRRFREIEAAIPADSVAGTRYDAHQMQVLDSEK